jgi:hypothetical protein
MLDQAFSRFTREQLLMEPCRSQTRWYTNYYFCFFQNTIQDSRKLNVEKKYDCRFLTAVIQNWNFILKTIDSFVNNSKITF